MLTMIPVATYEFNRKQKSKLIREYFSGLAGKLAETGGALIIDDKVKELYKGKFTFSRSTPVLTLPAGEKNKTLSAAGIIHDFFVSAGIRRDSCVYVMGGGSVTDVASYAVSTFKRGCRLLLIPTTLTGMIDASLGGKTAVNKGYHKNVIGTFYPAEEVIICPEFQSTLAKADLINGLAEMLKLWFINPALSKPAPDQHHIIATEQILEYAQAKLTICARDLEDRGERRLLNLGHTFGHILESTSRYAIPHGQAVAFGMAISLRLSCELGNLDRETALEMEQVISNYGFAVRLDDDIRKKFLKKADEMLRQDKKAGERGPVLILFNGYRQVFVEEAAIPGKVIKLLPDCI